MKRAFTGPGGRAGLFLAAVVLCGVAFWAGLITVSQWDSLWVSGSYTDSYSVARVIHLYDYYAGEASGLLQQERWEGGLNYTDQKRLDNLKVLLDPEHTNYRVEVHTQDGTLLYSNLPEGTSMDELYAVSLSEQSLSRGEQLWEEDYTVYNEQSGRSGLMIYLGGGEYVYSDPSKYVGQYNGYGYRGDSEGLDWAGGYRQGMDSRVETVTCTIQSGVVWPLTAEDYFQTDYADYQLFQEYLPVVAALAAVTLLGALWCLWALCRSAGYRGEEEEIHLSLQDRIPLDLYLLLVALLLGLLTGAGDSITYALNQTAPRLTPFVGLGIFTLTGSVVFLCLMETLAVRWKAGHMFRNTVVWRLCSRFRRWSREVAAHWSVTRKPVKTFLLYLLGTAITTTTVVLAPFTKGTSSGGCAAGCASGRPSGRGPSGSWAGSRASRSTPPGCTGISGSTPSSSTTWGPPSAAPWKSGSRASGSRPSSSPTSPTTSRPPSPPSSTMWTC